MRFTGGGKPCKKNNLVPDASGEKSAALRKAAEPRISQDAPTGKQQLEGIDVDKGTVQRIEAGKRAVSKEELSAIAGILKTTPEALTADAASPDNAFSRAGTKAERRQSKHNLESSNQSGFNRSGFDAVCTVWRESLLPENQTPRPAHLQGAALF